MTQRQLHFFKNKNATEETSWAVPNWTSDEPEDWKQGAQVEAGRHEREAVCFKVRRESEKSGNQTVMKASPSSYGVLIVVDQDTAGLILTWPSRCTCSRWPSPIYLFDSFIFYFLCFGVLLFQKKSCKGRGKSGSRLYSTRQDTRHFKGKSARRSKHWRSSEGD